MRKLAPAVSVMGVFAAVPVAASAGGKPMRSPTANGPVDVPAGMVCSFAVAGQPLGDNEVTKTFPPLANGDVVESINGHVTIELTNVDSGKSIVLNVSGPASVTTHPDGSVTAVSRGQTLSFVFPTDVPAGPATYLYTGRAVAEFSPDGQATLISHSGHRQDIGAELSS